VNHNFFTGVCIAEVNPSELEAGSVKALPRSLAEAVAALEADSVLRKGLGEPLVKAVLAVRKVSVRALDC
jgi:glutamine synthetase